MFNEEIRWLGGGGSAARTEAAVRSVRRRRLTDAGLKKS